jgi:hypothetical protein
VQIPKRRSCSSKECADRPKECARTHWVSWWAHSLVLGTWFLKRTQNSSRTRKCETCACSMIAWNRAFQAIIQIECQNVCLDLRG